ncbi:MAG TPA: hypothetical protein VFE62_00765 [Gemmataceae bacterium]|nr:hypothetical protein [Gemmataceae bacterium]
MGALIAFVGCLAFFGVACVALAEGSPGGAIVAAMVAVLFLAMAVAFVRLTQLGPPER